MRARVLTFGLALLLLARPLFAESTTCKDDPTLCGRIAFEAGVAAFEKGHLKEARSLFRVSLKLRSHPTILFNLALSELGLGDYDAGIAHLRAVLTDKESTAEFLRRTREQLEVARRQSAELRLDARLVEKAQFRVNGQAPARNGVFYAAPGKLSVSIKLPGQATVVREVEVRAGEKRELLLLDAPLKVAEPSRELGSSKTLLYVTLGLGAALTSATLLSTLDAHPADTRTIFLAGSATAFVGAGLVLWAFDGPKGSPQGLAFAPGARSVSWVGTF